MAQQEEHNLIEPAFIELVTVDSTNNYALSLLRQNALTDRQNSGYDQAAVFAHEQTAGKGQRGKNWASEGGKNIHLSLILAPKPVFRHRPFILSAVVAVAVRDFFEELAGENFRIKWPNDLYFQDRKAGGILIENIFGGSEWKWAVAGLGININQHHFDENLPNPVSLKQITGQHFDCLALAKALAAAVFQRILSVREEHVSEIMNQYNHQLYKKGEKLKFKKQNRLFEATVNGVLPDGRLVVTHSLQEIFSFGEVDWIIA